MNDQKLRGDPSFRNVNNFDNTPPRKKKEETEYMKAMVFQYDQFDTATMKDVIKPVPKENEVLVRVKFAAFDPSLDAVLGKAWNAATLHKLDVEPLVLGWHYSGLVERVGKQVSPDDVDVGDRVFGCLPYSAETEQGTCAEFITVPVTMCAVIPRESSVTLDVAAAVATEGLTALQALRDEGELIFGANASTPTNGATTTDTEKKPRVLINGAGGEVGSLAVRMAKKGAGAHVTAICNTKEVERVTKILGADVVVNRTSTPLIWKELKHEKDSFDVILDTTGTLDATQSLSYLKPTGNFVVTVPTPKMLGAMFVSFVTSLGNRTVKSVNVQPNKDDLELILSYLERKWISVHIDSTYHIHSIGKAMASNRDDTKWGRVIVQVEAGWD